MSTITNEQNRVPDGYREVKQSYEQTIYEANDAGEKFWRVRSYGPRELYKEWTAPDAKGFEELAEKYGASKPALKAALVESGLIEEEPPGEYELTDGLGKILARREKKNSVARIYTNDYGYEEIKVQDLKGNEVVSHHRLLAYAWGGLNSPFVSEDDREIHHKIPDNETTSCKWLNLEHLITAVTEEEHREIDPELRSGQRGNSSRMEFGNWKVKRDGLPEITFTVEFEGGQWEIGTSQRIHGVTCRRAQVIASVCSRVGLDPAELSANLDRDDALSTIKETMPSKIIWAGGEFVDGYLFGVIGMSVEEIAGLNKSKSTTKVEEHIRKLIS